MATIMSCNKDDDDNGGGGDNPSGQSDYRLTESISSEGGQETTKDVYTYDGEKLAHVMEYKTVAKTEWNQDNKTEVSYSSDNTFEMITSNYSSSDWVPAEKEVVTHQNGFWQTYMVYTHNGAEWVSSKKTDYTYSDGKITLEEGFQYIGEQVENEYKSVYSWIGDVPSSVEKYAWIEGEWQNSGKDTLTFSNGKLSVVETTTSDEGFEIIMKSEYSYTGDNVSSITMSSYYAGNWMEIGTITFSYDEHGNMTKMESSGGYMNFIDTYTYEEGKSNLSLIASNPGLGNFFYYGFVLKSNVNINNRIDEIFSSALSQM